MSKIHDDGLVLTEKGFRRPETFEGCIPSIVIKYHLQSSAFLLAFTNETYSTQGDISIRASLTETGMIRLWVTYGLLTNNPHFLQDVLDPVSFAVLVEKMRGEVHHLLVSTSGMIDVALFIKFGAVVRVVDYVSLNLEFVPDVGVGMSCYMISAETFNQAVQEIFG